MKYFPGDIVYHIEHEKEYIVRNALGDSFVTTTEGYDHSEKFLKLIRRADEMPWPDDVPRCELPLPEGKTRWAARGYAWKSESFVHYAAIDITGCYPWASSYGVTLHDNRFFYAEAVNDNDYTPPASEPASPPQGEGRITVERIHSRYTHRDTDKVIVEITKGHTNILFKGGGTLLPKKETECLIEMLTAAAKEVQGEH